MEVKDLMVGIYVYFHCFDGGKIIVKLTGFENNIVYGVSKVGSHWCSIEKVKPIPLTPEILEKNGWVKNLYSVDSYDNEELEQLSLWVSEDGKNKWWWHVGVELVTPINYVHELQYALHLCRIEKEIIL